MSAGKWRWWQGIVLWSALCSPLWAVEDLPLSAAEETVVDDLLLALQDNDAGLLAKHVDGAQLMALAVDPLKLSTSYAEGFKIGAARSLPKIYERITGSVADQKARVVFVRKHSMGDEIRLLLRTDYGDNGGLNFIDFVLNKESKIIDWYSHAEAAKISESLQHAFAAMLNGRELLGVEATQNDSRVALFRRFSEQRNAKQFAEAMMTLDQLPESFKQQRLWGSLRVQIAMSMGDDAYRAALNDIAQRYGDDPEVQLLLLDHYIFQQQHEKFQKAIELVQQNIGEDGHLQLMSCAQYKNHQQAELALSHCLRALELDDQLESAYWIVVNIGLEQMDAKLVTMALSAYELAFDKQFDGEAVAKLEPYQAIATLPEFQHWIEQRRANN